ncbi:polysaccharide biosynthesis C-terminal domain-containing protein [Clostridium botulinum]|uniref:Probable multidrug resistance protein NorM n=2 Tax=Clostridium botulinum TaxID=1491 RepID=A0A0A0IKF1_CLOBO|nr:MATE family efflux transporter [Clostridium botulinum]KEI00937.1 multidrug transporter MATE [Clostridium botulinum C/D str. BKT75002]KEI11103.1 multidrug transporter MATE [Clostridium botulinum C/D str. BKT2873]KGM94085.1 multidrug transporter MATE [Clostridium botulinum D str. CCUG 7971]KGN00046.1 multidrug transporter MATE [Clostridium botulinum C/D str. DC5]KOC47439.1 multidrug transporter MATE [Clostridium botulinum]
MRVNIFKNEEYKKINHIALPLILNNILSLIIELCDEGIMGRVSINSFAAVGIIETTVNSITGVLGALSIAFNIIGARCKGKKDLEGLNNNFVLNVVLSCIFGVIFFILVLFGGKSVLEIFYGFTGESLKENSNYLYIFSISLGLNMILFMFSSYLKIIDKTKYIFYGNVIAAISNVIFDYILVFGHVGFPKMGMIGNAIGSILALILNLVIYILVMLKFKLRLSINISIFRNFKKTIRLSIPLMGQEFLESTLIIIIVNSILSHIGTLEVAVYNLLFLIINIALMPMYGYSQAALTLISEKLNNEDYTLNVTTKCLILAEIFYVVISLLVMIFKYKIPCVITNDKELIKISIKYIYIVVICNVFYIPGTVFKHSIQSIGKEKWVFYISVIVNCITIGIILLFTAISKMGLYGVYFGMMIGYVILSFILFMKLYKLRC